MLASITLELLTFSFLFLQGFTCDISSSWRTP